VPIPALKGLSSQEARQALDRVGLPYRLKFLPSDAAPGTVVDSDPAEGQEVPADTEVTLFLAAPRSTAPTTGTSATPQGADEPDE
jgi:beta-lactam-binding protein with PASTA domain